MSPANVAQTDANIISYSGGTEAAQCHAGAECDVSTRPTCAAASPTPMARRRWSPATTGMLAQAALQHVVLTYDPVNGRKLYVNGVYTGDVDPPAAARWPTGTTPSRWCWATRPPAQRPVPGRLRSGRDPQPRPDPGADPAELRRRRRREVLPAVRRQRADGVPQSYIMMTVSQYDSYRYLFSKPTFISLDPTPTPGTSRSAACASASTAREPPVGQTYITAEHDHRQRRTTAPPADSCCRTSAR